MTISPKQMVFNAHHFFRRIKHTNITILYFWGKVYSTWMIIATRIKGTTTATVSISYRSHIHRTDIFYGGTFNTVGDWVGWLLKLTAQCVFKCTMVHLVQGTMWYASTLSWTWTVTTKPIRSVWVKINVCLFFLKNK